MDKKYLNQSSMKNFLVGMFLLVTIAASSLQAQKLKKTKVTEEITVRIPENFIPMSKREMRQEFATYRAPIAMYRHENSKTSFGINTAMTHAPAGSRQTFVDNRGKMGKVQAEWSINDLKMMKSLYKSTIMRLHHNVKFKQDKIERINRRNFVVLEFVGLIKDDQKKMVGKSKGTLRQYSYLMYTVKNSKIYIFNFSCNAKYISRWKKTAYDMMHSIKLKK